MLEIAFVQGAIRLAFLGTLFAMCFFERLRSFHLTAEVQGNSFHLNESFEMEYGQTFSPH